MGNPAWTDEPIFASRYARLESPPGAGRPLAEWTRGRTAWEATELLQNHGVAAFPVLDAEGRLFNPHFQERGLYADIEHPALGTEPVFNLMWQLSPHAARIQRHARCLGSTTGRCSVDCWVWMRRNCRGWKKSRLFGD